MKEVILSSDAVEKRRRRLFLIGLGLSAMITWAGFSTSGRPPWYFWLLPASILGPAVALSLWTPKRTPAPTRVSVAGGLLKVQGAGVTETMPLTMIRAVEVAGPIDGEYHLAVSLIEAVNPSTPRPPISFIPRGPRGDRSAAQSVATWLRREVAEAKRDASLSPVSSHSPAQSRVVH